MLRQEGLDLFCPLRFFLPQIGTCPTPFRGRMGGKFEAVEGKVGTASSSLRLTDEKNIANKRANRILHGRDKGSKGAMVRDHPTRQRHARHIVSAGLLDFP